MQDIVNAVRHAVHKRFDKQTGTFMIGKQGEELG
jgi:hypothetical protein